MTILLIVLLAAVYAYGLLAAGARRGIDTVERFGDPTAPDPTAPGVGRGGEGSR